MLKLTYSNRLKVSIPYKSKGKLLSSRNEWVQKERSNNILTHLIPWEVMKAQATHSQELFLFSALLSY